VLAQVPWPQVEILGGVLGAVPAYKGAERQHRQALLTRRVERTRDQPAGDALSLVLRSDLRVNEGDQAAPALVGREPDGVLVAADLERSCPGASTTVSSPMSGGTA
jgi:hypothetical protein